MPADIGKHVAYAVLALECVRTFRNVLPNFFQEELPHFGQKVPGFKFNMNRLFTVHLNDQNGIKFDQDKTFGVENLRAAFNQVKVLTENNYGSHGEYVGLDVKAMRTTSDEDGYKHLENSMAIFRALEEKVEKYDCQKAQAMIDSRDFEGLEMYVMNLLMGIE